MKDDEYFMRLALHESRKARAISSPNPNVGAVIVKNNRVISAGFTSNYGGPHAEVVAIKNSPVPVKNATMYVTLEPCSHFGKTPPCADLIIKHKFKRVVIGIKDVNPVVCGNGIKKLKKAGIEVKTGVLKKQIENELQWFIKYISKKTVYITLKSGVSLDGKITDYKGASKWITSNESLKLSQKLREENDGIIAGINTVLKDNPNLTYRGRRNKSIFYRIIFDSSLKIPLSANVLKPVKNHKTVIITSKNMLNTPKAEKIRNDDVIVIDVPSSNGLLSVTETVKKLYKMKISKLILEGGAELNYSFLKAGIVDKIILFIAPVLLGGKSSKGFIGGQGFNLLNSVKVYNGRFINEANNDFIFEGVINRYVYRCN